MRIYSMTATFGKLEHETLTLKPGLNILEGPNEWGKSTWCAFLSAMLYGIQTREHTTKTALADKERYAPWSGSPMAGQMELCWQGRDITIQRQTKGRIPMGEFSAFETRTGLPVPELTAHNCGQILLGVEKAVFLRSAFLRGSDLPVEPEESLRRRLHALVTTGEENAAADDLEKKLKELKNKCRANRTSGLIPQACERADALARDLETLQSLQHRSECAREQLCQLEEQLEQLQLHRQTMDYRAGVEAGNRYARALEELTEAQEEEQLCCRTVAELPPREQLKSHLDTLTTMLERRRALDRELEAEDREGDVFMPRSPAAAALDAKSCRRKARLGWLLLAATAVLAAGGAAAWYFAAGMLPWGLWTGSAVCLAAGLNLLVGAARLKEQYQGADPGLWALEAEQKLESYKRRQMLTAHLCNVEQQLSQLTCGAEPELCVEEWRKGLQAYERWEAAVRRKEQAERFARTLKERAVFPDAPGQEDTLTMSRQETAQRLSQCTAQIRQLQLQLGSFRGQMAALGEEESLRREWKTLNQRIRRLEETYSALKLALRTLAEARTELQRRFAPQIVKKTQDYFSLLTSGRYLQLAMEEDLHLHIRAEGEDTLRPSLWRSEGTVDQLYLALRLAVASELVPDAPLVLDDALVRFDDERLKTALRLLEQEAKNRQILLFTCQSREKRACNL